MLKLLDGQGGGLLMLTVFTLFWYAALLSLPAEYWISKAYSSSLPLLVLLGDHELPGVCRPQTENY